MKQRNLKKLSWFFRPSKGSNLKYKEFKYKSDLMKFLNNNFFEALNGEVALTYDTYNSSGTHRTWDVWYNDYSDINQPLKIELRQSKFRGSKYVFKIRKYSDGEKKWICFSNKILTLMCALEDTEIGTDLHQRQMKNLIELFYKRGYKDINIEDYRDEYDYDSYISMEEPIPYSYWSDRCNFLRCAIIINVYNQLYEKTN